MSLEFMATTVEGFEDIAAQEVKELGGCNTEVRSARVFFQGGVDLIYRVNIRSRCVHKLVLILGRGQAFGLDEIYSLAKSINYFDVIKPSQSFAVRTTRVGKHDYTSIDISAKVGQAIVDSFKEVKGVRPRVDLKNPDVEVDVYVKGSEVVIGINTTGESLHKRNYRVYDHPAALKTTIAASMLRFSGWNGNGLLDPMCGGGTITIEAALMARKFPPGFFRRHMAFTKLTFYDPRAHREELERALSEANREHFNIYGFDISPKHIKGALLNAMSAGVNDTVTFAVRDSTREETYSDLNVKFIVANPPYGIRQSRPKVLKELYTKFLKVVSQKLSGSILTVIIGCPRIFELALEKVGSSVLESREVMHGNLLTKVYKIKLS